MPKKKQAITIVEDDAILVDNSEVLHTIEESITASENLGSDQSENELEDCSEHDAEHEDDADFLDQPSEFADIFEEVVEDKPTGGRKKAAIPPKFLRENMSLFEYLRRCTPALDQKIIDIACSQAKIPPNLRNEASQDIRLLWSVTKPKLQFKPGQIASYAHRMARHAAYKTKREIGGPVRLPASAFRKKKDGTSYVTPGMLADAIDWNSLESWMHLEDSAEASFGGSISISMDNADVVEHVESMDNDQQIHGEVFYQYSERMRKLNSKKHVLTRRQYEVMCQLVEGSSYEEIEKEFQIKKGILLRELAIASGVLDTD